MELEEYPLRESSKEVREDTIQNGDAKDIKTSGDSVLTKRIIGFVFGICASFFIAAGASCVQVDARQI